MLGLETTRDGSPDYSLKARLSEKFFKSMDSHVEALLPKKHSADLDVQYRLFRFAGTRLTYCQGLARNQFGLWFAASARIWLMVAVCVWLLSPRMCPPIFVGGFGTADSSLPRLRRVLLSRLRLVIEEESTTSFAEECPIAATLDRGRSGDQWVMIAGASRLPSGSHSSGGSVMASLQAILNALDSECLLPTTVTFNPCILNAGIVSAKM